MNFMTLDLPAFPGEKAEADVLGALAAATDRTGQPLFAENGVQNGVDAVLLDSYFKNPGLDVCPLVMMQTWTENEVSAQGGGRIYTPYMMSFYFLYYFGVPSNDFVAIKYVQQRRRHIAAAMKAIEMNSGGNAKATIPPTHGWKWDTSRQTVIDYMTPFAYFGGSIVVPPSSGYNCVRVDRPISVWH
jgi:hypothetical protein